VIAVAVENSGTGYDPGTEVEFSATGEGHAKGVAVVVGGKIVEILVTYPGAYSGAAPTVSFNNTGSGTGAKAIAVLGNIAVLDLEIGRGSIGIVPIFNPRDERRRRRKGEHLAVVAAYGYAYEGHCYRFDKPRLLGVTLAKADVVEEPIGCGFDSPVPGAHWYKAWRLRSNDQIIEMGTSVGRVEELILDANRPGRRPPNTYASEMQLAHRGGRLNAP
jgi:hypothetical protein